MGARWRCGGQRGAGAHSPGSVPGHPLTVAGLAPAAFPQRAGRRGHPVIAAAELGAPALRGLVLLSLGPVGRGGLGREDRKREGQG